MFLPDSLQRLAESQRSLFSLAQALAAGMTQDMLDDRRAAGDLWSPHRAVYGIAGATRSWEQSVVAACLAGGPGTVGSFRSALQQWELLDLDDPPIEISIPRPRSPRFGRGRVIIHRPLDLRTTHCTVRRGVPVTNPLRSVIDAAGVLGPDAMQAVLDAGVAQKLFTLVAVDRMRARLAKPGKNGPGKLKALLDSQVLFDRDRTVLEAHMARLWRRFGLPPYEFQLTIRDANGKFVARADFGIVDAKVLIEVDGWSTHGSPTAVDHDARRRHRLNALGWLTMHFSWYRITHEPEAVAAEILAVLSVRLAG